ncbi:hypothetical protein [Rhizobium phage RHph_X2_30]|nr:hypothetical protein [Rhizobium phage RHph_X2_30]
MTVRDAERLREAILDTLARTNEPMLVRDIAAYLTRRGWTGHMTARVSSAMGVLRADGKVLSIRIATGRIVRIKAGWTIDEVLRGWFLPTSLRTAVEHATRARRHHGRPQFRKPPEPYARTDDMRQMLDDLRSVA